MRKNLFLFAALMALLFTSANLSAQVTTDVEQSNSKCRFYFNQRGFVSAQNPDNDYVVYEISGMSASEIKTAAMTTISSMYKSPKDVVNNLSDNMIQLEGYMSRVYYSVMNNGDRYPVDIAFSFTVQFKDGKVRFNAPSFKQIYITNVPLMGQLKLDMSKSITTLIDKPADRDAVAERFNSLIKSVTGSLKSANDW